MFPLTIAPLLYGTKTLVTMMDAACAKTGLVYCKNAHMTQSGVLASTHWLPGTANRFCLTARAVTQMTVTS